MCNSKRENVLTYCMHLRFDFKIINYPIVRSLVDKARHTSYLNLRPEECFYISKYSTITPILQQHCLITYLLKTLLWKSSSE